jgi:hypothetical protein
MQALPCVDRVVRISEARPMIAPPTSITTECASGRTRCMCSRACAQSTRRSTSRP